MCIAAGEQPAGDGVEEEVYEELTDRNCACTARTCSPLAYERLRCVQDVIYIIVTDLGFELFITAVIILNVVSMAISFYGMPTAMSSVLDNLNYVGVLLPFIIA